MQTLGQRHKQYSLYTENNIEKRIENDVIEALQNVDEVKAIYMQRYRYDMKVSVILNSKMYDDEVVEKLLDIEYPLHLIEYGDFLLDFRHLPSIGDMSAPSIQSNAKLILKN